uniref:(northern house mosquito) hypothetical protein n=1 Tax=Culex pipiens TaxID=7175 RepID=A0A8D8DRI0_CULPI
MGKFKQNLTRPTCRTFTFPSPRFKKILKLKQAATSRTIWSPERKRKQKTKTKTLHNSSVFPSAAVLLLLLLFFFFLHARAAHKSTHGQLRSMSLKPAKLAPLYGADNFYFTKN